MSKTSKSFLESSKDIAFDIKHRNKIKFNISKYDSAVKVGESRYTDIENARRRAGEIKRDVLANLHSYLLEFEKNALSNGIEVLWAKDDVEAISYIIDILKDNA